MVTVTVLPPPTVTEATRLNKKTVSWLNLSLMGFAPKGVEADDSKTECIRDPSATRPLSPTNTDNKFVCTVYNH